jgi:hypothetical protein
LLAWLWHLNKVCAKLYEEQKLFSGQLMKMLRTPPNRVHKADWGADFST